VRLPPAIIGTLASDPAPRVLRSERRARIGREVVSGSAPRRAGASSAAAVARIAARAAAGASGAASGAGTRAVASGTWIGIRVHQAVVQPGEEADGGSAERGQNAHVRGQTADGLRGGDRLPAQGSSRLRSIACRVHRGHVRRLSAQSTHETSGDRGDDAVRKALLQTVENRAVTWLSEPVTGFPTQYRYWLTDSA
jgi:hypothetical protein